MILPETFYTRNNVLNIAKDLLGKIIVTEINDIKTSGKIVEVEAYNGINDKASHAYNNRRTNRTEIMYCNGGVAYIYLCYGIHHLFNVVTNTKDIPHAILIRAIEPIDGITEMLCRRKMHQLKTTLTSGPGALSMALGITTNYTGISLQSNELHIEDRGIIVNDTDIVSKTRVGVAYAQEDALLPYRFYIKNNPYVSKGKGLE